MVNLIKLEKISKEDIKKKVNEIIDNMNNHNFKKLKKTLNKAGVLDDIC